MTINFYQITDDYRVVEKTLGDIVYTPSSVNLLDSCSVKNPSLVLSYNSALVTANYFKIVDWDRYYFMGEPVVSPGGRCIVTGREDVLMSNAEDILKLDAYCSRCESKFERYAVDSAVMSLVTTNVTTIPSDSGVFSADGTARQYILTVKGGYLNGVTP